MNFPTSQTISLPDWINAELKDIGTVFGTIEQRMGLAIHLASENVRRKTGGPFGAAVFEIESGKLIAVGVNIVTTANCSLAHAEAMALMLAQKTCNSFDLSAANLPAMELVTSAQPCIQCFGNTWWSGVTRLVIGANVEAVEKLGFNEGPLPENWRALLENRTPPLKPIEVLTDVLSNEACKVLEDYKKKGGQIYNAGSSI